MRWSLEGSSGWHEQEDSGAEAFLGVANNAPSHQPRLGIGN